MGEKSWQLYMTTTPSEGWRQHEVWDTGFSLGSKDCRALFGIRVLRDQVLLAVGVLLRVCVCDTSRQLQGRASDHEAGPTRCLTDSKWLYSSLWSQRPWAHQFSPGSVTARWPQHRHSFQETWWAHERCHYTKDPQAKLWRKAQVPLESKRKGSGNLFASHSVCPHRRRYTILSTLPFFTMFLPSTPVTNTSTPYLHLPTTYPDFPCRNPQPQLLFYYLSTLGHFCARSSSLLPIKPGSIPSQPPSAVKSCQTPCDLLLRPPWTWWYSHWAPATCARRWDLLSMLVSTTSIVSRFPLANSGKEGNYLIFQRCLFEATWSQGRRWNCSAPSSFIPLCPWQLHWPHSIRVKKQLLQRSLGDFFVSKWLSWGPVRGGTGWNGNARSPPGTVLVLLL